MKKFNMLLENKMKNAIVAIFMFFGFTLPLTSHALLSFGVNCNGFSLGPFSFCVNYSWTGVCADGCAVSGVEDYASDCATAANAACSGCGGLVVSNQCDPGFVLQSGVCVRTIYTSVNRLAAVKEKKLSNPPEVNDQYCQIWNRYSCEGKCIEKSKACGEKCFEGLSLDEEGSCVEK
jgi:hypothetical protein